MFPAEEELYPTETEVFVPIEQTAGAPAGKRPRPESGEIVTEARYNQISIIATYLISKYMILDAPRV